MARNSISVGVFLFTFVYCKEINEVPEPPKALKSLLPPPETANIEGTLPGEDKIIGEPKKPSALQGKLGLT